MTILSSTVFLGIYARCCLLPFNENTSCYIMEYRLLFVENGFKTPSKALTIRPKERSDGHLGKLEFFSQSSALSYGSLEVLCY